MKKPPLRQARMNPLSALGVVEEATHLLRKAPMAAWLAYFLGSAPLVLYVFYFWNDMSQSGNALGRLLEASLLLALIYGWMKVWQAVFCNHLMRMLEARNDDVGMPVRGWCRLIGSQVLLHATMPVLLLLALVALLPFAWVYAFYHNVTILAVEHFRHGGRTGGLVSKALSQAHIAPKQNHLLILIIKCVALLVYANVFSGIAFGLTLSKSLLGYENAFSMNPLLFMHPAFQVMLIGVAYLLINPWIKSLYVIRCFYGLSMRTGEDIQALLRQLPEMKKAMAMLLAMGFWLGSAASLQAQPATPEPQRVQALEQSIQEVMQKSEYQWRLPREGGEGAVSRSWIGGIILEIGEWVNGIISAISRFLGDLIEKLFGGGNRIKPEDGGNGGMEWAKWLTVMMWSLVILLVAGLVWLIYHYWKQNKTITVVEAEEAPPIIDLEAEQVVASQLPVNEWLRLAREKMNQGDLRLALRALFLATLAHLGEKRLLSIAKSKSNGDYVRELAWRARGRDDLYQGFREQVQIFDQVWYGWHAVNEELMTRFEEQHERIINHAV